MTPTEALETLKRLAEQNNNGLEGWSGVQWIVDDRNRTFAVLQGAYAAEIHSAAMIDNPYSRKSVWRWCWATGFDLGQRIDKLRRHLREASKDIEELVGLCESKDAEIARLRERVAELEGRTCK